MNKKTIVLGASPKQDRYSNRAVKMLNNHQHDVVALGFENSKIDDILIHTKWEKYDDVDTVTLYLNPQRQKEHYNYILSLHPKRIIFNPGTENPELEQLAIEKNIQPLEACTLVLLSTGQF
ncbi:MAG TPA: CoA-binding protein [Chitinophagales bacterium]|jgi:predicted CoA-binding protein|nr:CoA-binding protein [Chitinophagales bacterium]MBP6153998.1 CoA-binding protein [Chitinophagales bacterium]HQV79317.1 CoA-binding protein [Chitinophagales bacterium]HQW80209.1 CoA-binding protein [Chitinophagales bacterium]HRB68178.1 CoA-binding protein [Chitinophagales bacterium]